MKTLQYPLPDFLSDICTREQYIGWLDSQATRHRKRDRRRGNATITREQVKRAVHAAVILSAGRDAYTGQLLDWHRISTYSNELSAADRRAYKRDFHALPTVDHVGDGLGAPDFRICAWRTNDCKSDLTHPEFIELCHSVISHHALQSTGNA